MINDYFFNWAVASWADVQKCLKITFEASKCKLIVFCLFWVKEKSWINYSRSFLHLSVPGQRSLKGIRAARTRFYEELKLPCPTKVFMFFINFSNILDCEFHNGVIQMTSQNTLTGKRAELDRNWYSYVIGFCFFLFSLRCGFCGLFGFGFLGWSYLQILIHCVMLRKHWFITWTELGLTLEYTFSCL